MAKRQVDIDPSKFEQTIDKMVVKAKKGGEEIEKSFTEMGKKPVEVKVDVNKKELTLAEKEIEKLTKRQHDIKLGISPAKNKVELANIAKRLKKLQNPDPITVKVNTDEAKTSLKDLEKTAEKSGNKLKDFLSTPLGLGTAAVAGVGLATAAIGDYVTQVDLARESVLRLTGISGDSLTGLTADVKSVADTFDKDFNEVLESTNAISKEFGITQDEALEKLKTGFLNGADATGELLASTKEYSSQIARAGGNADDLIKLIETPAKEGILADKGIDAVKEFGLSIGELTDPAADALEAVGINVNKLQDEVERGVTSPLDAMQLVSEKLAELPEGASEVGLVLADLFKGGGEDAGLRFVKMLADMEFGLEGTVEGTDAYTLANQRLLGANEDLNVLTQDLFAGTAALTTEFESFAKETLVSVVNGVSSVITVLKPFLVVAGGISAAIVANIAVTKAWGVAQVGIGKIIKTATAAQKIFNVVLAANPVGAIVAGLALLTAGYLAVQAAMEVTTEELIEENDAQKKLIEGKLELVESQKKQAESNLELVKDLEALADQTDQTTESELESQQALNALAKEYPSVIDETKSLTENVELLKDEMGLQSDSFETVDDATRDLITNFEELSNKENKTAEDQAKLAESTKILEKRFPAAGKLSGDFAESLNQVKLSAGLTTQEILGLGKQIDTLNKQQSANLKKGLELQVTSALDGVSDAFADAGNILGDVAELLGIDSSARNFGEEFSAQFTKEIKAATNSTEIEQALQDFHSKLYASEDLKEETELQNKLIAATRKVADAQLTLINSSSEARAKAAKEAKVADEAEKKALQDKVDARAADEAALKKSIKAKSDAEKGAKKRAADEKKYNTELKRTQKALDELTATGVTSGEQYEILIGQVAKLTVEEEKLKQVQKEAIDAEKERQGLNDKKAKQNKEEKNALEQNKEAYEEIIDELTNLQVAGKNNTDEFDNLLSKSRELKEAIEADEAAIKSLTDTEEDHSTELEKNIDLYDANIERLEKMALAGQQGSQEFKDLESTTRELGTEIEGQEDVVDKLNDSLVKPVEKEGLDGFFDSVSNQTDDLADDFLETGGFISDAFTQTLDDGQFTFREFGQVALQGLKDLAINQLALLTPAIIGLFSSFIPPPFGAIAGTAAAAGLIGLLKSIPIGGAFEGIAGFEATKAARGEYKIHPSKDKNLVAVQDGEYMTPPQKIAKHPLNKLLLDNIHIGNNPFHGIDLAAMGIDLGSGIDETIKPVKNIDLAAMGITSKLNNIPRAEYVPQEMVNIKQVVQAEERRESKTIASLERENQALRSQINYEGGRRKKETVVNKFEEIRLKNDYIAISVEKSKRKLLRQE